MQGCVSSAGTFACASSKRSILTASRRCHIDMDASARSRGFALDLENALRQYKEATFDDGDVTRCTGLSVRSWRELLKLGAVQTTGERGHGRVRLCDHKSFKRSAVIAQFHRAGFSLSMAGRLGYLLPFDERIYRDCDPIPILFDPKRNADLKTQVPRRRKDPRVDWFDPNRPSKADPEYDCLIDIFDARFVGFRWRNHNPWIYGELRDDGRQFVSWYPFHRQNFVHEQIFYDDTAFKEFYETSLPKWDFRAETADKIDLNFLDYSFENHSADDDSLRIAAQTVMQNPVVKTSINISLAVRTVLRRYLGMDPGA